MILLVSAGALTPAFAAERMDPAPDWFWFFYERSGDSFGQSVVYRPFFMETVSSDLTFQASLMPLFFSRYKTERNDRVTGFFGFYQSTDYVHKNSEDDYDSGLFPLFMYGEGDSPDDDYLFVYPIGGTIKGKFAYERISPYAFPGFTLFFLFPPSGIFTLQTAFLFLASLIPVYTEFKDRDYAGTALFWPFITWGSSESGRRSDFRVLPFYSHNQKAGWYDNYSYMLLVNYRELYFKDDTRYTFFFLPFFGRKWSREGKVSSYTVLWPFFSWGYDSVYNDREYNLPWPFVQIRDCDNPRVHKRVFFPFYGRYNYENYESFFVTPLYFRITDSSEDVKAAYHISCIVFWYFKRDYSYNHEFYGRSWRYYKLWPLFQVEWSDSGFYSLNILSLLPFRDTAGYERMYQPFWTLFEYRVKPGGEKHLGVLLRTYYQVWNNDFMKIKVPLVFSYAGGKEGLRELSFLAGAFGYEKGSEGSYLKFLWLPIRVGEGSAYAACETFEEEKPAGREQVCLGFNSEHANVKEIPADIIYASARF